MLPDTMIERIQPFAVLGDNMIAIHVEGGPDDLSVVLEYLKDGGNHQSTSDTIILYGQEIAELHETLGDILAGDVVWPTA